MPIAFLVVQESGVRLLPVNHSSTIDKLMDYVPDLMDKANGLLNKVFPDKNKNSDQSMKQNSNSSSENKSDNEDENNTVNEYQSSMKIKKSCR